jgi:hypothetical protein
MRLLLLFILSTVMLFAVKLDKREPIKTIELDDGTMLVKIALNYEDPVHQGHRIRGVDGSHTITLPIPGNWKVLDAKGYVKYSPSMLLQKDHSSGVISFNNMIIKQFKLFDNDKTGVKFKIDPSNIDEYNSLKIEMVQHYINKCEDSANSQLWTEIDLGASYVEFHIEKTAIPEQIQSLTTHMMDKKQYELEPINYVISKNPSDMELYRYAVLTGAAANSVRYREAPITVSDRLDLKKHNVLITTKDKVKEQLNSFKSKFIFNFNPIFSMHFNDEECESCLNDKDSIKIEASKDGLELTKDGAFYAKSLYLNGGIVTLNNLPLSSSDNITVSLWFNPANKNQKAILFGFDSYTLFLNKSNIGFRSSDDDLYGDAIELDNKWHHVVATFNTSSMRNNSLYIDGKRVKLHQIYGDSFSNRLSIDSTAVIGGRLQDTRYTYNGGIDQLYIFDNALSESYIKKVYDYSKGYKNKAYSESIFISEKIKHDINVIRNPLAPEKAILLICPESDDKINDVIYAFYKKDLSLYFRQGINITSVEVPKKAEKYSAKGYIPVGEKVYFKELGYETTVRKGWYPPPININFKVYPDHYFENKGRIKTHLEYVFPTTVNRDSVANIFLNDKFAKQIDIMKAAKNDALSLSTTTLFDIDEYSEAPVYLLNKGHNKMKFEFSLVPDKKDSCSIHNTQNLLVMIMDNSYFTLPKSLRWIEMPYMQYISNSAYPYSIYPDLQDTQLVITNNDSDTIAAAMNFMFFISQELQSFPYYVKVTQDIAKADKDREIVLFGSIHDQKLQALSSDAPVTFEGLEMNKPYPFIKEFVEHKSIADSARLKKYRFVSKMKETNQLDKNLLMQMYKSPYNSDKTLLMFAAENPKALNDGVTSILSYQNRHIINGDTLIYNPDVESGVSFDIKDKYVLTSMNLWDRLSLQLSVHPFIYILVLIIAVLLLTIFVRALLVAFKKRNHKHVE